MTWKLLEQLIAECISTLAKQKYALTLCSFLGLCFEKILHLFQVGPGKDPTDYRFFLRAIIRHSDLVSKSASFEYMRDEGERVLLEAMDELGIL